MEEAASYILSAEEYIELFSTLKKQAATVFWDVM
jgi:hypothetical protein